jgi:hypothetical protein
MFSMQSQQARGLKTLQTSWSIICQHLFILPTTEEGRQDIEEEPGKCGAET